MNGRPRKIVELPDSPSDWKSLEREAVHLHAGRLWRAVPIGCVLCLDLLPNKDQTLQADEDHEFYLCAIHGKLEKVPFTEERKFEMRLGPRVVEVTKLVEDFLLFPECQTSEERLMTIEKIINEAAQTREDGDED